MLGTLGFYDRQDNIDVAAHRWGKRTAIVRTGNKFVAMVCSTPGISISSSRRRDVIQMGFERLQVGFSDLLLLHGAQMRRSSAEARECRSPTKVRRPILIAALRGEERASHDRHGKRRSCERGSSGLDDTISHAMRRPGASPHHCSDIDRASSWAFFLPMHARRQRQMPAGNRDYHNLCILID